MALEKGTTLAGYQISGILGQGGMGVVYEATQISLNRTVALKVLAPHLSDDISFRERFRREGQIQAGIDHDHIVTVYEAGESEHGFFIAMRLIRGPNLKDMIVARQLDPGRTLRILSPIADALDMAHKAGLIHRDIKPQNILVGGRDQAFLADFGLTKGTGEQSLTRTGQFVGTFDYISPEQIKGDRATTQSDVYSLAAVLYECFTGVVPYPKDSEAAVLYAHMADPPPKITDHRPELPATLDEVIAAGMAKEPGDRYESTRELLQAMNESFTRRMRAAFTPPGPIEAPQETGIRSAEAEVETREAPAPGDAPPTEPGALEAETAHPAGHPETVRSGEPPARTEAGEAVESEPAVTRASADAPPAVPDVTVPAAAASDTAPGEAPDEEERPPDEPEERGGDTPATAVIREPGVTRPAQAEAGPTRLGRPAALPASAPTAATTTLGRPPAARASTPVLLGAAGLVLALVVAAGFLLGSSGGDSEDSSPDASSSAQKGALSVSFPDTWSTTAEGPEIPGLRVQEPISLSRPGAPRTNGLLAGITGATGPALLPKGFLDALGDTPARDDAVKLGELEAYRYQDLRPEGYEGGLTLYVAPTSEGVATVACASTASDADEFLPSCEQVAGGLELVEGEPFPLGPDEKYLATLDKTISTLNAARKTDLGTLRKAKKQAGQAKAATALAKDYRQARTRLQGLSVSPAVSAASVSVRRALQKSESAYTKLAAAARRGSESGFAAAKKDVRAGESALKRALAQVDEASS